MSRAPNNLFLRLQSILAGRFSLEREIGRGGMGVVYLARDVALERPVAIKVLAPELSTLPEMRARFLREARVAAQCFHPHIVPVHAVEEDGDLAWIVMAYVRGESLADRLRRTGPLDGAEVRRLAREVGWALSYAHQRGVVHRDIKPENLLIDASTGRYLLADFGIAHLAGHDLTPAGGTAAGTVRYMAPEQALGEAVDGRADLYALGVTLFVAATGRAPFEADNALALVTQHAIRPAPAVHRFAPALPLPMARAIDRCLAKRPDDRYPDVEHFLAAIEPDVREQALPPVLYAVRDHASSARSVFAWAAVIGVSTALLMVGEDTGFGRSVFRSIGSGITGLFVLVGGIRAIEAGIAARRLLRVGHAPEDVNRALAGEGVPADARPRDARRRLGGLLLAAVGAGLAVAQGTISGWQLQDVIGRSLPGLDLLDTLMHMGAVFLPPVLIARGVHDAIAASGAQGWIRARIVAPLAAASTRLLGGGSASRAERVELVSAPTEMLLLRAVESALHGLPSEHRGSMEDVHRIAQSLAAEVERIRAQLVELDARETDALALRDSSARDAELGDVHREREAGTQRLQTAIAALESLRLDVLRLMADESDGDLTNALARVRDVQHRIAAAADVRQLLRDLTSGSGLTGRPRDRTPT